MKNNHLHICLFRPEIPQNTGSTARLAAATQCRLHLIKPLGFDTSDRNLRRAGLDYWPYLDLEIHDSLEQFLEISKGPIALMSKHGTKHYTEIPADCRTIIFGQETKGLPDEVRAKHHEKLYRLPMFHPQVRSINLASAVAIVTYHQMNQLGCFAVNPKFC
jgi:tRNA (cytidine/uridine-2'-O-)-methyltransferase